MTNHSELKGLGGWLILVGIGLLLAPLRIVVTVVPMYQEIFSDGTWNALSNPDSEHFHPELANLIVWEVVQNGIMVLALMVLAVLFFRRHYLFPRSFIAVAITSIVLIVLNAWEASRVFPGLPVFDPDTLRELGRSTAFAAIWVPYMLVSRRVGATFVEGRREPVGRGPGAHD